jgi:hypothetical protein
MRYLLQNAAKNTTAAPVKQATGTSIRTMMQLKPIVPCRIIEWGCSFDAFAAALPGSVELIETDVAATSITAFVAADITPYDAEALQFNSGDPTSNYITVSSSASGFNSAGGAAEGTTTVVRNLDGTQLIAPTNQYIKQFPLGERPYIQAAKFGRVRVTFAATVNMTCYMIVEF